MAGEICIVDAGGRPGRRRRALLSLERPSLRECVALGSWFSPLLPGAAARVSLDELAAILEEDHPGDFCIAVERDPANRTLTFWRGDPARLVVPQTLVPAGGGVRRTRTVPASPITAGRSCWAATRVPSVPSSTRGIPPTAAARADGSGSGGGSARRTSRGSPRAPSAASRTGRRPGPTRAPSRGWRRSSGSGWRNPGSSRRLTRPAY